MSEQPLEVRYVSPTKRCSRCGEEFPRRGYSKPRKDGLMCGMSFCRKCSNAAGRTSQGTIIGTRKCDHCGEQFPWNRRQESDWKRKESKHRFCNSKCKARFGAIGASDNPLGPDYCRVPGCQDKKPRRQSVCMVHLYRHRAGLDLVTGEKKEAKP